MKCTNMFNGRREWENVSFHSSNAHASSLSLFLSLKHAQTHTHTGALMSVLTHTFPASVEVNNSFAAVVRVAQT